jgi:endonuclease I
MSSSVDGSSSFVVSSSDSASSNASSVSSSLVQTNLIASPPSGYDFWYWHDTRNDKVFGRDTFFNALLPTPNPIEGVYRIQPTNWYSTGFETLKSGYQRASATFDGRAWTLEDAVTSMVAGDKREGTRSVRLHGGGYIQTDFSIPNLASLQFKHAVYTTDESKVNLGQPVTLALQFSQNLHRWVTLDDEIYPTVAWTTYNFSFDALGLYVADQLNPNLPTYLRIVNQNQQSSADGIRINVDALTIQSRSTLPEFPLQPHQSNRLTFAYDVAPRLVYERNETVTLSTCLANDGATLVATACDIDSNLDTNILGSYDVVYAAVDGWGDAIEDRYEVMVIEDLDDLTIDYQGYYDGIEGLYGDALVNVLREKSYASIQRKSYLDAKTSLPLADVNPTISGQSIAIYTGNSLASTWDGGSTWQREHVWPNSRLGTRGVADSDINIASDLHNLRFIEAGVNQSRSNKGYAATTSSTTYFPGPDRGDVARIYFYMAMHYDHLSLTDALNETGEYLFQSAQSGLQTYLLSMHADDPVSVFETARHSYIKQYQGNPNPFIDYPSLAYLINW